MCCTVTVAKVMSALDTDFHALYPQQRHHYGPVWSLQLSLINYLSFRLRVLLLDLEVALAFIAIPHVWMQNVSAAYNIIHASLVAIDGISTSPLIWLFSLLTACGVNGICTHAPIVSLRTSIQTSACMLVCNCRRLFYVHLDTSVGCEIGLGYWGFWS